jgi:hypothetical protein
MSRLSSRVDPTRLRSLVAAAVIVGMISGLVAAVFASVAGEPATQAAIAIEEANLAAHDPSVDEGDSAVVSRRDQRGIGLFGAFALTGAAFGALLALTSYGLRRGRTEVSHRLLVAGAVLAGAFTVGPWLKYPPNPPAVGSPSTLSERQTLYVAMICIGAIVGLVAAAVSRRARASGWPDHRRIVLVAALIGVPMLVAFVVLPPAPDPVPISATLVWRFRLASLGASLTLWTLLTLGTSWLAAEALRHAAHDEPAVLQAAPLSA